MAPHTEAIPTPSSFDEIDTSTLPRRVALLEQQLAALSIAVQNAQTPAPVAAAIPNGPLAFHTAGSGKDLSIVVEYTQKFSSNELTLSAQMWVPLARENLAAYANNAPDNIKVNLLHSLLEAPAKTQMADQHPSTPEEFFAIIQELFDQYDYEGRVIEAMPSGKLFEGISKTAMGAHARQVFKCLSGTGYYAYHLTKALLSEDPECIMWLKVPPTHATAATFDDLCRCHDARARWLAKIHKTQGTATSRATKSANGSSARGSQDRAASSTNNKVAAAAAAAVAAATTAVVAQSQAAESYVSSSGAGAIYRTVPHVHAAPSAAYLAAPSARAIPSAFTAVTSSASYPAMSGLTSAFPVGLAS